MMTGRDNRTPMGELGPYDEHRELARPVAEVADAIWDAEEPLSGDAISVLIIASEHLFPSAEHQKGNSTSKSYELAARDVCRTIAQAALDAMRKRGFLTLDAIAAIKEEKGK
jgi:hypothetical protein